MQMGKHAPHHGGSTFRNHGSVCRAFKIDSAHHCCGGIEMDLVGKCDARPAPTAVA